MSGSAVSQPAGAPRFAPGRSLVAATLRELLLAISFFAFCRLLIVLAVLAVFLVLAGAVTDAVLALAVAAVTLPAFVQVDRMLERARLDLAETRRATLWAAARAAERGGDASAPELLRGFRLFDRGAGWLTRGGRKLARERSLALLAATFDRVDEGHPGDRLTGTRTPRRATASESRGSSHSGRPQPTQW